MPTGAAAFTRNSTNARVLFHFGCILRFSGHGHDGRGTLGEVGAKLADPAQSLGAELQLRNAQDL